MQRFQAFKYELMPIGEQQRIRRVVQIRLQQGAGVAEGTLRAGREEARLRRAVQAAHRVASQHANAVAGRCTNASAATGVKGFGAGLRQLLRQTGRLSALQEEGPRRQLPLSRPEADQARSGQSRIGGQPAHASVVFVCGMRVRGKRRCGRRDQHSQGGARPLRRCSKVASSRNPLKLLIQA